MKTEEEKRQNRYWTALGETDGERHTVLVQRKKAMRRWREVIKGALQRALTDIRKYVLDSYGRLVPAPKVKLVHGCHALRSSRRDVDDDNNDDFD